MTPAAIVQERVREQTGKWVSDRPIAFEQFIDLYTGREEVVELVDGVIVERERAQLDHEKLVLWLLTLLAPYAEERELGVVRGSRTAVTVSDFRGRLPGLLFVSAARQGIVQQRAVYGAPDLVNEVTSPSDRPSTVVALEADYRSIGVPEMVFIDMHRRRVRAVREREAGYEEQVLTGGALELESLGGLRLELGWLLDEARPPVRRLLGELLG